MSLRLLTLCTLLLLPCLAWGADSAHPTDAAAPVASEHVGTASAGAPSEGHAVKHVNPYDSPPLLPQLPLFVFSLLLFWLFISVMGNACWKPMISAFDERDARVVRAEQTAAKVQSEAERLRTETEAKVAEVHAQVKAMLAKARSEAEAQGVQIVAQAEAEAQRVKMSALQEIAAAREQAVGELNARVDEQVAFATSQLLK